ncbi:hypothetical protein WMY93_016227 [Mugilogobius chulae]|uniref:Uncharacterized protein n=1 Tax=Mugilogobius chulae TaxID=88201 RepID=A0AAW0NZH6_9GOBI
MNPLTVALDILQAEDNCFNGTLLPTLETFIWKTNDLRSGLQILKELPKALIHALKTRFVEVFESEETVLAAVCLQDSSYAGCGHKNKQARLLAECRKVIRESDQQPGTSAHSQHLSRASSTQEEDYFGFGEDEEDTSTSAESQVADYLRSTSQGLGSLSGFSLIKKIS